MGLAVCTLCALVVTSYAAADETPEPADAERAEALFQESRDAYLQGDFERSAALLEQAYELRPGPELLYNLARLRELQGRPAVALETYRRLLELHPESPLRTEAEAHIGELVVATAGSSEPTSVAEESTAPAPQATTVPDREPAAVERDLPLIPEQTGDEPVSEDTAVPLTLLIAGAALVAASIGVGVAAQLAWEETQDATRSQPEVLGAHERAVGFGVSAIASLTLGAGATVTAILLLTLD